MNKKLSLLDDSSDSEVELTVNKKYANTYNEWRNKEELQKYKDLQKDEEDSESSSESEEEIPEFDEEFFRALSLLKGKDPRIYNKDFELFKDHEVKKKPKTVKKKPVYMKDYERNLVLEKGGQFSDEDDDANIPEKVPTYDEEQENLKKSFKDAVGSDSDSDAGDLLEVRTKTKKEEEEEEADYVKWLKGEKKEISDDIKKDMSYLRDYWNDPKLDKDEKFLKDYILNKRYLEKDESEVPTYEELTSGMLSDDEKMLNEQETFEHKYNFRFEEPDEEFIKRYPRTIGDSLRRTDNRRKQKREEKAERVRRDREQRREELKRLKALKRKEIEEKFMKLKEISGQEEINLNESDIESDFDPDKHDQRMHEIFNDDYYQVEEDKKPEFPHDDELDSENWNTWTREKIFEDDDDDDDDDNDNLEEDAKQENEENSEDKSNFKEEFANEMINASCSKKKKMKKKSLFAKIVSQPKPIYDPDGKSFEDYLDEYYKLDYEDIVGDMPVRYKYRKVIPNDFGLSVDEILTADDKELNRWCSVKKTCQYRKEDEELYDVQAFQKKAQIPDLKKKCFPSVYVPKEIDNCANNSNHIVNNLENPLEETDKNESNEDGTLPEENVQGSVLRIHSKKKKHQNSEESSLLSDDECINASKSEIDPKNFNVHEKSMKRDANEGALSSNKKNNRKSVKRKKEDCEDSFSTESNSKANETGDVSPKSKQKCLHSQISPNLSSNIVPEDSSAEPTKKKKKKKKKNKQGKNEALSNVSTFAQKNHSKPHNKSKDKFKQYVSEDKRLGLSDERLAAYGINPKKFKNKIMYSK